MNKGIVESTSISSRDEIRNILLIAPLNIASKPRDEKYAPSAVPAIMIANSGAPLMNAIDRRTMSSVTMSVPRSHPLGRGLAAHEIIDVDHHVHERVDDDQDAADRD